eukprot:CAMPEP_0174699828 /NCGR_PEP_ID=MMETSP1094-20130205/4987_1 /TAXON_ID=156173 /ORGANISM="Chrysochromulina brevifilum, Strain UTEX LB 985" /LENGTH=72 /DNA_ID=CAMNT_0015897231 /DNA_START=200 /DNA_END=415 /DNA_ORIENTATION=+
MAHFVCNRLVEWLTELPGIGLLEVVVIIGKAANPIDVLACVAYAKIEDLSVSWQGLREGNAHNQLEKIFKAE